MGRLCNIIPKIFSLKWLQTELFGDDHVASFEPFLFKHEDFETVLRATCQSIIGFCVGMALLLNSSKTFVATNHAALSLERSQTTEPLDYTMCAAIQAISNVALLYNGISPCGTETYELFKS